MRQLGTSIWQDIDRARWLARYPALTVMVLLRYNIGYRLLSPTGLILFFVLIALVAANGNNAAFRPQDLFCFAAVMLAAGLSQRFARWMNITRGIPHHTYYVGTSWLEHRRWRPWFRRNHRIPRFVDPMFCILIGLALFQVSPLLGAWLTFSGLCLGIFEDVVFRRDIQRRLDIVDGIFESELQARHVEYYTETPHAHDHETKEDGLPTGIGPDIEEQIKHRKKQTL